MGDPGSEIIESVPPAGPEASESTTDENEDDIQFVSEGPLRPVLEYIDLVSSDDEEPSTSHSDVNVKHKDHIDHQKDKVALTLARLARHVEVEKQQKEEKNRAFRANQHLQKHRCHLKRTSSFVWSSFFADSILGLEELSSKEEESQAEIERPSHQEMPSQSSKARTPPRGKEPPQRPTRTKRPQRVSRIPPGNLNKNVTQLVTAAMARDMEKLMDPEVETRLEERSTEELVQHVTAKNLTDQKVTSLETSINALAVFVGQVHEKQTEILSLIKMLPTKDDIKVLNKNVLQVASSVQQMSESINQITEKLNYVHARLAIQDPMPVMTPATAIVSSAPPASALSLYPVADLAVATSSYSVGDLVLD